MSNTMTDDELRKQLLDMVVVADVQPTDKRRTVRLANQSVDEIMALIHKDRAAQRSRLIQEALKKGPKDDKRTYSDGSRAISAELANAVNAQWRAALQSLTKKEK